MTGPKLWGLMAVTMTAFASNSILNRVAVDGGHIDPISFAVVRVLAGAVMLALLVLFLRKKPTMPPLMRFAQALWLTVYLFGFSVAYVHLDAGLGALILFGGVQVTMFAAALVAREPIPARRWAGAAFAFTGLIVLVWPQGAAAVPIIGAAAMSFAALGWGLYSVLGRGAQDPLAETASSFILAVPMVLLTVTLLPVTAESPPPATHTGYALAILSGAVTSGLGYALWYTVLRHITGTTAALVQLSAPVIAVAIGAVLLGEVVTVRILMAGGLILGGITLGVYQRRIGSSGS